MHQFDPASDPTAHRWGVMSGARPRPIRPTVLIADDEPVIVELLALLLDDEGFGVLRAYDGEEAWQLLCSREADLVISDVSMPRLDGLALVTRLRQVRQHDVPVILMSAQERTVSAVDATNVTFVPKPFDLDVMVDHVRDALTPDAGPVAPLPQ